MMMCRRFITTWQSKGVPLVKNKKPILFSVLRPSETKANVLKTVSPFYLALPYLIVTFPRYDQKAMAAAAVPQKHYPSCYGLHQGNK